jgi:hypothetical protein
MNGFNFRGMVQKCACDSSCIKANQSVEFPDHFISFVARGDVTTEVFVFRSVFRSFAMSRLCHYLALRKLRPRYLIMLNGGLIVKDELDGDGKGDLVQGSVQIFAMNCATVG